MKINTLVSSLKALNYAVMWSQREGRFVNAVVAGFVGSLPYTFLEKKKDCALALSSWKWQSLAKPELIWLGKTFSPVATKKNTERPSCGGVHHSTNKFPKTPKASCWERKRLCSPSKSQLQGICKYQNMCHYTLQWQCLMSNLPPRCCLQKLTSDSRYCRTYAVWFCGKGWIKL